MNYYGYLDIVIFILTPVIISWLTSRYVTQKEHRKIELSSYEHKLAAEFHSLRSKYIALISSRLSPLYLIRGMLNNNSLGEIESLSNTMWSKMMEIPFSKDTYDYFDIPNGATASRNVRFVIDMLTMTLGVIAKGIQSDHPMTNENASAVREIILSLLFKVLYMEKTKDLSEDCVAELKEIISLVETIPPSNS